MSRTWLALLFGLTSAALALLGLEVDAAAPLAWVALVPVLVPCLLYKDRYGPSAAAGLGFGAGLGGGLFRWLLVDGRWAEWLANLLGFALMTLIWSWLVWRLGSLPAPAAKDSAKRRKLEPILPGRADAADAWAGSIAHLRLAMVTAASWTVLEWARGLMMPGWNPLGLAIARNLPLLQLVKATGPTGLGTMVVFANSIVLTSVRRLLRQPGRMSWAGRFDVTATLAVIFLGAAGGFYGLTHASAENSRRKVLCASDKNGSVDLLVTLSESAGAATFDLLVWREAAFTSEDFRKLDRMGVGNTVGFFSGLAGLPGRGLVGSRAVLPGSVTSLFAPMNNVAFFVPFNPLPNQNLRAFTFRDVSWLPLLNWQGGSPALLRASLPQHAQVWIALFEVPGRSRWAGRQLRDNLRLWAAAYGRALVFSGRGAGSLLQAPTGRVVSEAQERATTLIAGNLEIPPSGADTLYGQLGDWWPIAMGFVVLMVALRERLKNRYAKPRRLRP
ncbi:MAG: hypothetical protein JO069_17465 [Verrucomicrobia bacterium]|nr:hypothetical protein [Verrucomicrobiota bacterium]